MLATHPLPFIASEAPKPKLVVRAAVIIYEVAELKRTFSVSVTVGGAMACNCNKFRGWGECQHIEAVELERLARRVPKKA